MDDTARKGDSQGKEMAAACWTRLVCAQGSLPRILGNSAISLQEGREGGNWHPSSDEETEAEVG